MPPWSCVVVGPEGSEDEGAFDLTRSAHDLGGRGGDAGLEPSAAAADVVGSTGVSDVEEDRRKASVEELCPEAVALDTVEAIESRCTRFGVVGLEGRIGTAGMIGTTGRLLLDGVGACCELIACVVITDDGVVGCVDAGSEGTSDV